MAVQVAEAKQQAPSKRRYSKVIGAHLRRTELQDGQVGVEVEHHYKTNNGEYREPHSTVFHERAALHQHIDHLADKMGMAGGGEPEAEE